MISNGLFYFILVFSLCFFWMPEQVSAQENETSESDLFYICKREKLTRWLRAYRLESGKCNTLYSKEGYLQIISSANYFTSCEGVLHSVQKNLEEGGFKCAQASSHSVIELD